MIQGEEQRSTYSELRITFHSVVARYLGDREDRLEGEEYYSLIDEFMAAIKLRWPRALIQFEDFQSKHAVKLLARYF